MLVRSFITPFVLAAFIAAAPAYAEKRVALIVGNGDYQSLSDLNNPVPDADAIAKTLKEAGFTLVVDKRNLSFVQFYNALQQFKSAARGAETALVYYAGHGMAIEGADVLAPVDMPEPCSVEGAQGAVPMDWLFEAVQGAQNKVVLLDACRNDPAPSCVRGDESGFRGLSRIEGSGLLIANSTSPGARAGDGAPGKHSPFAAALLKRLKAQPKAYFYNLLQEVAEDVADNSKPPQVPEVILRGRSPRICLAGVGCEKGVSSAGEQALIERLAKAEAMAKLAQEQEDARRKAEVEAEMRRRALVDAVDVENKKRVAALEAEIERLRRAGSQVAVLPPVVPPPVGRDAPAECGRGLLLVSFGGREPARCMTPGEGKTENFRDCDDKICPEMVVVPAGTFQMGSPDKEPGRYGDEGPRHSVTIPRAFAVGKYEVSFDEWDACVKDGGCDGHKPDDRKWGRGRLPVINVSWNQAQSYVAWISKKTGRQYRLPSEAEWEYVARAGTQTPFWWGKTITTKQANYDGNAVYDNGTKGEYRGKTMPVNTLEANPWGLFHVHGNVDEWVEDCYADNYSSKPDDLKKTGAPFKTESCKLRVVRGGSWYNHSEDPPVCVPLQVRSRVLEWVSRLPPRQDALNLASSLLWPTGPIFIFNLRLYQLKIQP